MRVLFRIEMTDALTDGFEELGKDSQIVAIAEGQVAGPQDRQTFFRAWTINLTAFN